MRYLLRPLWLVPALAAVLTAQTEVAPPPDAVAERVKARARELAEEVAAYRGLAWKKPVDIGVYREDELRAFIQKELERELPDAERYARGLKALGALPADYALKERLLALLTEQIGGFFDPRTGELKLIARGRSDEPEDEGPLGVGGEAMERTIIVHELVHALQDQHFDLASLPLEEGEDDDLTTALRALVEGDATAAMMGFEMPGGRDGAERLFREGQKIAAMLKLMGGVGMMLMPGMDQFRSAPKYLQETMMFPYLGGLEYCLAAGAEGKAFAGIDEQFRNPPLSTEQVLHPEKALGPERDHPQVLKLPDLTELLGPGAELLDTNALGELYTRVVLDEALAKREARTAAAGWDGDRYAVYARKEAPDALVWLTTWDTDDDAGEFEAAAIAWMRQRFPKSEEVATDWAPFLATTEGGRAHLVGRRGRDVAIVLEGPREKLVELLKALLERSERSERTRLERKAKDR